MSPTVPGPTAVIFDLGGVVIGWDPTRAYAPVLPADQIEGFLARIDFPSWNHARDSGQSFARGEAELAARFPHEAAEVIGAYRTNFGLSLTGTVPGTSAVIAELQRAGTDLVGLTNWSAETFPTARERFGILRRLRAILVSGEEQLVKPDPAIFALACDRFGLVPERTVFVDDAPRNVAAATAYGLIGVQFRSAEQLRDELTRLGLLLTPPDRPTAPVYHLAVAAEWADAERDGRYPWSTRGVSHEAEGYVHCSFAEQTAGVRSRFYADLAAAELVLLEVEPAAGPWVVEDLGAGQAFPHLYAELDPARTRRVRLGGS